MHLNEHICSFMSTFHFTLFKTTWLNAICVYSIFQHFISLALRNGLTPPRHQCQSDEWVSNSVWSSHQRHAALNAQPWEKAGRGGRLHRNKGWGGREQLERGMGFFLLFSEPHYRTGLGWVECITETAVLTSWNKTSFTDLATSTNKAHTNSKHTHYTDSLRQTIFSTSFIIAEIFIKQQITLPTDIQGDVLSLRYTQAHTLKGLNVLWG